MSPLFKASALLPLLSVTSALPSFGLQTRDTVSDIKFDAKAQYVSNQGDHAFIAPGPNDSRSPCPALNVMANHGYIPRNGFVTLLQIQDALPRTFGLSSDLVSFLSLIFLSGTMKDGAYDIGGFPASLVGVTPYQYIQTDKIGTINDVDSMKQICTNYNAINGDQYRNADFFSMGGAINDELFMRAFSNKSAEYPLGELNTETKLAMLAMIPNGDGTFTWNKFHNSIPDDWYKSNALAPFSIPLFVGDVAEEEFYGCAPKMYYGNTNMALLTNGAYTNKALEDPKTNMCFLAQAAPLVLPRLAAHPMFDAYTRNGVASAVSSIRDGMKNVDCSARTLKSLNLGLLSTILGVSL